MVFFGRHLLYIYLYEYVRRHFSFSSRSTFSSIFILRKSLCFSVSTFSDTFRNILHWPSSLHFRHLRLYFNSLLLLFIIFHFLPKLSSPNPKSFTMFHQSVVKGSYGKLVTRVASTKMSWCLWFSTSTGLQSKRVWKTITGHWRILAAVSR